MIGQTEHRSISLMGFSLEGPIVLVERKNGQSVVAFRLSGSGCHRPINASFFQSCVVQEWYSTRSCSTNFWSEGCAS